MKGNEPTGASSDDRDDRDDRLTPDEFARLMTLPENDPERVRAALRPDFEARLRLYREFETPSDRPPFAGAAAKELEARVLANLRPRPAERDDAKGSWLASLVRLFEQPAPRAALALGALLVVAGTATWFVGRDRAPDSAVRGGAGPAFTIGEPRRLPHGIEISWPAVPGATAYRVTFFGADLNEKARVDGLVTTALELDSTALPAGLEPGVEVLIEVTALAGSDPIAVTPNRVVRLE